MRVLRYLCVLMLCGLVACQPDATPLPAFIPPTPSLAPTDTPPPTVRYGLSSNTTGMLAELPLIQAAASVEQLNRAVQPQELGTRYEIAASYGDLAGWTISPLTPHAALILNPNIAPLNDSTLAAVVRRSINVNAVLETLLIPGAQSQITDTPSRRELRAALANAGWPDGFDLTIAHVYTPGITPITEQLAALDIQTRMLLLTEAELDQQFDNISLALILWTDPVQRAAWETRVGAENVVDLYTLPISYWAAPGLSIAFTPGGWPIPSR